MTTVQIPIREAKKIELQNRLHGILEEETQVENGVLAAELIVSSYNEIIFHQAYGLDGEDRPLEKNMLFDVASLTKPVCTASALLYLDCEGKISIEDRVSDIRIGDVLLHRTYLPKNLDWQKINQPDLQMPDVLNLIEEETAQERMGYSNTGYVLLSTYAESTIEESLEEYLSDHLWKHLGMKDTTFLPDADRCIPTATDQAQGRPYDPLADFMVTSLDKTPGHSGLFSTAHDLNQFVQALLLFERSGNRMQGTPEYENLSNENKLLMCWANQMMEETEWGRSLGFDILASGVFEQTGYTGCMMLLHLESGKSAVLLTNKTLNDADNYERLQERIMHTIFPDTSPYIQ